MKIVWSKHEEKEENQTPRLATKSIYEVEGSFDWLRSKLDRELKLQRVVPTESEYGFIWLKDIFADRIIVEDEDSQKLYEIGWEMDSTTLEVSFDPPVEVKAAYVTKSRKDAKFADIPLETPIIQRNAAKQLAYGAVLVPGEPDYYGDVLSKEKIVEVAHEFMLKYRYNDLQHEFGDPVAEPVESYISPRDMDVTFPNGEEATLPEGSWIMAVKVVDEHWQDVENGEIRGFSIAGISREQLSMIGKASAPIDFELEDIKVVPSATQLADDWIVPAVSLVDNPAVGKALFFALKTKTPEKVEQKPSILDRIFGKKGGEVPEEVESANKSTQEESDPEMADNKNEEKSVELDALVTAVTKAMSDSNEELLRKAGIIKAEPTQEELIAAAVAEAMKPLQEEIKQLKSNDAKAESAEDEDEDEDEDAEEEEAEETEDLKAAVKALRKEIRSIKRGSASSRALGSDDDDDDYSEDGEDDGRDLFGRRTAPLK